MEKEYYLVYLDSKEQAEKLGIEISSEHDNNLFCIEATKEQAESLIPDNTDYCYTKGRSNPCPFWQIIPDLPKQSNGFCHFLRRGDFTEPSTFLLWDQCKECGVKPYKFEG